MSSKTKSTALNSADAKQQKRIEGIIEDLSMQYYNIVGILNKIDFKPTVYVQTAGVDKYGRGVYNPAFTKKLTKSELQFVIMHEVYHVILRHMTRFEAVYDNIKSESELSYAELLRVFNIASDAFINENLKKSKTFRKGVLNDVIDFEVISNNTGISVDEIEKMNSEQVFEKLLESQQQNESYNGGSGQGCESSDEVSDSSSDKSNSDSYSSQQGSGDSSDSLSGDILTEEITDKVFGDLNEFEKEKLSDKLERAICGAVGNSAGYGGESKNIKIVEKACNANLEDILNDFVYKVSGRGESVKTYRRPNKYYRNIYPYTKGRIRNGQKDIVFSIDVSCSMDVDKISKSVAFIESYQKKFGVGAKYYFFSYRYSEVYEYTNKESLLKNLQSNYGGGTSIEAALRDGEGAALKDIANGIVVVSDMEFFGGAQQTKAMFDSCGIEYFGICVDTSRDVGMNIFGDKKFIMI